jgi:PAP2 superfamily
MKFLQVRRERIHFWLTGLLAISLVPAAILSRLRFPPDTATFSFLAGWALQSTIWAAVLYQIGIRSSWSHYLQSPFRLIPATLMVIVILVMFGPRTGGLISIAAFAIAEFQFRGGNWKRAAHSVVPFLYLAFGIQIAVDYSSVIVSFRPCTQFDSLFARLDSCLLLGHSVPELSRTFASLYGPAEATYYILGGVMGAGLLFLCLAGERRQAFQMSGAILLAYYMALFVFFFFPAQGPFISGGLPSRLFTAPIQHASLSNATFLYHHAGWITPPRAYYVAFPSLHVAQPLIVAWFLRRWRVVSALIGSYCILLIPAILILQWHYLVDILAGIALAVLAILIVSDPRHATESALEPALTEDASVPTY